MVLAFALAVELFPPFRNVVQFRVEVNEDFNLFAGAIEGVAGLGISHHHVVGVGVGSGCFHCAGTFNKRFDVETCHRNWHEAYGGQHRESSAHVVGDYESLVAFFLSQLAQCALLGVGDGDDALGGFGFAHLLLEHLFEEAESDGRLGGCSRF